MGCIVTVCVLLTTEQRYRGLVPKSGHPPVPALVSETPSGLEVILR